MISQGNTDYMAWSQFLKGNYRKGADRLKSMLNSPPQAADLIKDEAALAVVFGSRDAQTDGLLAVIAESGYADAMARNYMKSVADTDEGFTAIATPEMRQNVCLASTASAASARMVWKDGAEGFVARAKTETQLDLAAKALKSIDAEDFGGVPASVLSKLSPYVGKNDRAGYLHLVGQKIKLGFDDVSHVSQWVGLNSNSMKALEFILIDINADEDGEGDAVGFTLMSKRPFYLSPNTSYGPGYSLNLQLGYNYYYADPTSKSKSYSAPSCMVSDRMSNLTYSDKTYLPLVKGEIVDLAKPVKKDWVYISSNQITSDTTIERRSANLAFWQPTLGNLFGDELSAKLDGRWCSPGDGHQYEWLKDFENLNESSVSCTSLYSFDISESKITVSESSCNFSIGYNPYMGSNCPCNMLTSSWILPSALSSSVQYARIPVVNNDGSISPWSKYGGTYTPAYLPNIYMCI